jgi:hypothetical protein
MDTGQTAREKRSHHREVSPDDGSYSRSLSNNLKYHSWSVSRTERTAIPQASDPGQGDLRLREA